MASSEVQRKLLYLQLSRAGLVDHWTLLEVLGIPNVGTPPMGANSITDRLMAEQQMGMGMSPQQFYGNQMPVQQMPQQQFYQSPQQMQTGMPQQMGMPQQASMQQGMPAQSQGQVQTCVQQTQIPQQQQQQAQQVFVPSYGQSGFVGQQG